MLLDLPPERGVHPGAGDSWALQIASRNGHTEIVRLLLDLPLERGPGAGDNYAIQRASRNGYTEIVRLLLYLPPERGVHPAAYRNCPFAP